MSATLPVSPQIPIVWSEQAILEKGMIFLSNKKEQLNLLQDLWDATKGPDNYSNAAKIAGEKVKVVAETSKKELDSLKNAVIQILDVESIKDPLSEKTQQLSKIASATLHGLSYFSSVIEHSPYPTLLRQRFNMGTDVLITYAVFATIFGGASYFLNYTPPSYALISWKVSGIVSIIFVALRELDKSATHEEINKTKNLFEIALTN